MRLVTAEEVRRLDRATIERGTAGVELMERAGAGVAAAIERQFGPVLGLRVLVLCGTGNNGGDGFVAARSLAARGAEVHVGILGPRDRVRGDARSQLERMEAAGVRGHLIADAAGLDGLRAARDVWDFAIDALLGTGARGEPEGLMAEGVEILRQLDDAGTRVIAVDLPTGVDTDTGAIARRAVRADLTVTFSFPKRGHWLYPARAFVGALEVVDIGLVDRAGADDDPERRLEISYRPEMADRLPLRPPLAHKGSVGRVLLVGGSVGLTGAIALAARAASRTGAGYVRAAVPKSLNDILEIKLTEEMTVPVAETRRRSLSLAALPDLLELVKQSDVVALGSGMSRDSDSAELARQLAARARIPMVIDADGLHAFAGRRPAKEREPAPRIVTPHVGEMSRLTGLDPAAIERDRIEVARKWSAIWGVVVVLKGAPTVTARPDGHATVNTSGGPALATAGTGDVLCGMLAALVGQGLAPYDAARLGVYLHGLAADGMAEARGVLGLTAGDLLDRIPLVLGGLARDRDHALEKRGVPTTGASGPSPGSSASGRRR
jgi:ADP-dependent NAD(P)H-hydrate dehydratase / NAD(P)H-hydrate epimerase